MAFHICCPGAGGMSGLYHALTGCHLPGGRLEGVAEGNALGRGPVIFEVNASAIDIVRKLAARAPSPWTACALLCCLPAQAPARVPPSLESLDATLVA